MRLKDDLKLTPNTEEHGVGRPTLSVGDAYDALDSFADGLYVSRDLVAYVSTPITTGLAFYELLATTAVDSSSEPDSLSEIKARAMRVNSQTASEVVAAVIAQGLAPVCIDPTPLKVKGSSQDEYLDFWLRFIRKRVGILVLAPGWEYSTGSTAEYVAAVEAGIVVLDGGFSELPVVAARRRMEDAVAHITGMGFEPAGVSRSLRQLSRFPYA